MADPRKEAALAALQQMLDKARADMGDISMDDGKTYRSKGLEVEQGDISMSDPRGKLRVHMGKPEVTDRGGDIDLDQDFEAVELPKKRKG